MSRTAQFSQLATYNQWMNKKLYDAAAAIGSEELHQNKGAFFGSIFGTLNHLVVADTLWLKRFANHPAQFQSLVKLVALTTPTALDQQLCGALSDMAFLRATLDEVIIQFCAELSEDFFDSPFEYKSTKGILGRKVFGDVLMHLFNHQTHHRGQATTLFSQLGIDVGATDLILLLPDAL
jgi:uncharacterized damage-inducible protein DinB